MDVKLLSLLLMLQDLYANVSFYYLKKFCRTITSPWENLEGLLNTKFVSDTGSSLEAFANDKNDASLCWKDIGWLRSITSLPNLIKGVFTPEDAIKVVQVGVAGIIVSNHGGGQLDYTPATISVVHAVEVKIPVLMDGGIRQGIDVSKALALGAKAALIGKPVIHGLAAKGGSGERRVIKMRKDEFEFTMAHSGCPRVKHITRNHVRTESDSLHSKSKL
ncbi:hypothetical protein Pint_29272 [Pistacia integerrima]|uniref:Uncharacterized protein n=1 Tax=Pistacia integerrima TaxID=434235 RepID=A0ACC0WZ59_9ROSI|nr:hypothetical protein Pint_29272 [Pistacia integerrima]